MLWSLRQCKTLWRPFKFKALLFISLLLSSSQTPASISSLYGKTRIEDPLIRELLSHPYMQRLQAIDMGGPSRYFRGLPPYSVFDHAIAVYVILKQYKRPFKEQVAGLLKCVAHSTFSNFGTLFLQPRDSKKPYYIAAQKAYLEQSGITSILKKYLMDNYL